jgi:CHAT domain-containing protein
MKKPIPKNCNRWSIAADLRFSALALGLAVLGCLCCQPVRAQDPQAEELLARALHFADLYNWADAAPAFTQAEQLFDRAGDRRNAFYARFGRIRSNIERGQQSLPQVSADLGETLQNEPLLQSDKELRMFALIVKGDIDTEMNTGAMRRDWDQVESLAREQGNQKWQYRALAQLGIAAFYDGDLTTARTDVGTALQQATAAGDKAAQVRFLVILATGLIETKNFDQALAYLDNATKLASTIPDAGYQFQAQEMGVEVMIGLNRLDAAQRAADDILMHAREAKREANETATLGLLAEITAARNDRKAALRIFDQAISLGKSAGLTRLLADLYGQAADLYKQDADLENAERSAELSAESTQASGDLWAVPQRLMTLAEIQVARGRYLEADREYDRAEAFIDSMLGNLSTILEKTAVITASSQIYAEHFALLADRLKDPPKAFAIIEQVRGRVAADLLRTGTENQTAGEKTERAISQLKLKLMAAKSTEDVRELRDEIFMAEQAKWITPGVNILKTKSRETIGIEQIRESLPSSAVFLEYVIADPASYCFTISRAATGIVRLGSKTRIEALVGAYLKAVKAKQSAASEARALYDAILRPVREAAQKSVVIVVRDGQLHSVPFDALREPSGRYVVENRTVLYSPSAATFYLLAREGARLDPQKALLAVGGIPYSQSPMNRAGLTSGYNRSGFADLPASADEVRIAQRALRSGESSLLLGRSATEAAFKREPLQEYRIIHLAVHAFADSTFPDRAALVLLSDPSTGEDGFLQASEVAQLHLNADLVVLSACDTAVGALLGQEGIANLSRAFLLAGARTVVSTLWQVDDSSSLFLMRRFYTHLAAHQFPAAALTAAKRDMLATFGRGTLPVQWAAFTIEGRFGQPLVPGHGGNVE